MELPDILRRHGVDETQVIEALGVSAETMRLWKKRERRISIRNAITLEEMFGIPRHELRPDIYPPPHQASEAAA